MRIIVTGGNGGVGKATAAALAVAGHGGVMGLPLTAPPSGFEAHIGARPPRPFRADVDAESKLANLLFVHELARRRRPAYASDPV